MITLFSALCEKQVVSCSDGAVLGSITDIEIATEECRVTALIIDSKRGMLSKSSNSIRIPWDKIEKIGVDIIIVNYCAPSVTVSCCDKPQKKFGFR